VTFKDRSLDVDILMGCRGPLYLSEELHGNLTSPFMSNKHDGDEGCDSLYQVWELG